MTNVQWSPRLEQVLARLVTQGLLLATGPLLARSTGPAGRGEAAVGVALAVLLPPIVGLGFGSAVRSLWSTDDRSIRSHQMADLRGAGWRRAVLGGAVAALIGLLVVTSGLLDLADAVRPVIVLAAATAGLSSFVDGLVSLRLVEGRQRQAALTRVLPVAAFALYCLVSFAADRLTATSYIAGYAALPVLRFAIAARSWSSDGHGGRPAAKRQSTSWRSAGVWGVPHELSDAGLAQVAVLAAGLSLGAAELGLFAVALTVARMPNFVASGVSDSDVARIATARREGVAFDASGAARRLMTAMAAVSAVTAVVGWFAVPFVFGTEFAPARISVLVLLLASPLSAAIGYLSSYYVGFGNVVASAQLQLVLFGAVAVGTGVVTTLSRGSTVGRGSLAASVGFSLLSAVVGLWAFARVRRQRATL